MTASPNAKKILIVAFHGNPGNAQDYHELRLAMNLPENYQFVVVTRPKPGASFSEIMRLVDEARSRHKWDRCVFMGFSMGAYFGIRYVREKGCPRPDGMILVNPTLVVTKPLTSAARIVANTPVIGRLVLSRHVGQRADEFIGNVFRPKTPPARARDLLRDFLTDAKAWQGAVRYKAIQQDHPLPVLPELPSGRMLILRGSQDTVAPWEAQAQVLEKVMPKIQMKVVENAGHSLLWTDLDEVSRSIREFLRQFES